MRDIRFKAVHRGGMLDLDSHRQLALWAADCAEHVLALFEVSSPLDERPRHAIAAVRAWAAGEIRGGAARTAAVAAHVAAREATDVAAREAARAAGHAAATAHMADHALGSAWYAIRAVRAMYDAAATERERVWQLEQTTPSIRDLVVSTLKTRKFSGWAV